jgi:translation initiation factor 4G
LSMDELSGTPDAGITVVKINAEKYLEAKEKERDAVIAMFVALFKKKRLKKSDFDDSLTDIISFIDSFVCDVPHALDYVGELIGTLLQIKAVNIAWLCHQCKEHKAIAPPAFNGPEKIVRHTMQEVKKKFGNDTVADLFGGSDKELSDLLGAEKWTEIKSAPL